VGGAALAAKEPYMQIALLRVGIDTGTGGIHSPLFKDGSFEFIPIPDRHGFDDRTYGSLKGRFGKPLIGYFPEGMRARMKDHSVHVDPDFKTFTYGDPTVPKSVLERLQRGDFLVFYSGLKGWSFQCNPALFIVGFFEILLAQRADAIPDGTLAQLFRNNAHYRNRELFRKQRHQLVLIKGSRRSRLLTKAVRISAVGRDRLGRPLHILSPGMQKIFGNFGGRVAIQRSPPRWIDPDHVARASEFLLRLE
jgi:hypothetical protein